MTRRYPHRVIALSDLEPGVSYRIAVVPRTRKATSKSTPPVTEGEHRTVEIETVGDQDDGIARVKRGFVIILPDTDPHECVEAEITSIRERSRSPRLLTSRKQ